MLSLAASTCMNSIFVLQIIALHSERLEVISHKVSQWQSQNVNSVLWGICSTHYKLLPWIDSSSFLPDFLLVFPCLPVVLRSFPVFWYHVIVAKCKEDLTTLLLLGILSVLSRLRMTAMDLAHKGGFARGPELGWPFVYRTMRAAHEYLLPPTCRQASARAGQPRNTSCVLV